MDIAGNLPDCLNTLVAEINKLRADLAALKASFDGHTHQAAVTAQTASGALTSAKLTHTPQSATR